MKLRTTSEVSGVRRMRVQVSTVTSSVRQAMKVLIAATVLITVTATEAVSPVYGEFVRTFTFGSLPQPPIVQPGGSLVFPIPTVPPVGVTYVDEPKRVGLLVPRGTYLASWTLNPSEGAS